jgi:hypothetical protein
MNNIKLILLDIKGFFTKSRGICILFCLLLTLIIFTFIYALTGIQSYSYINSSYDQSLRTFVVKENDFYKLTASNLETAKIFYANDTNIEKLEILMRLDVVINTENGMTNQQVVSAFPLVEDSLFQNVKTNHKTAVNVTIPSADAMATENLVIYSVFLFNYGGQNITHISGIPFNITAAVDMSDSANSIINSSSIFRENIPISQINIQYKNITDSYTMMKIQGELMTLFPGAVIEPPVERDFNIEEIFNNRRTLQYGLMILAVISLSFMYIYLMNTKSEQVKIYLCLGCTGRKLFVLYLFEIIGIYILCFAVNIILYRFIFIDLLIEVIPMMRYTLNFKNFTAAFLINLGLLLAVFLPIILHFNQRYMFRTTHKSKNF